MRIVLCDDDEQVLKLLKKYLREYFHSAHLNQPDYTVYTSGDDLLVSEAVPSAAPVDIVFLDVEMPGRNGIFTGALLKEMNPNVRIFIVTSFPDYLDDAMKFHVFRYLSKPLEKGRLYRNMKEALYQISIDTKPILIETANESVTRYADEVIMVESNKHIVKVFTVDQVYESTQPMKYWETFLDVGSFYKIHRSYIVNMKFVRSFDSAMVKMCGADGQIHWAYMARRRYVDFKHAYIRYLEAMK